VDQFKKKSSYLAVLLLAQSYAVVAEEVKPEAMPDSKVVEQLQEVSVQQKRIKAATPNDAVYSGSKTETPIRDIPASVSVVTSEMLEDQVIRNMNDAMIANAPGVQPQLGGGYGFGDSFNSRGLALSFQRDTMPDGFNQNSYFRTFYDIERIEVLKGPGSALFGSVGPGGTINVISKQPQYIPKLTIGTLFGRFDTFNGFIDATGKLTDGVAGRLIVDTEHTSGYRGLDKDITEFSPSIRWDINDNQALTVDMDHRNLNITPDNYGILFDNKANIADVSTETRYYSTANETDQKITRINVNHDWKILNNLSLRTGLVNDQRDLYLLRNAVGNITATNGFNRNLREQNDDARYTTFQNELTWKFDTAGIKHTLLSGLEFNQSDTNTRRTDYALTSIANIYDLSALNTSTPRGASTPSFNRTIKSDTVSVYFQDQIEVGDYWKVRGGLRNDKINFEDKGFQFISGASRYREIDGSANIFSGSFGLVFQPNKNVALYAGYSEGGFINLATEPSAIATDPETSEQIEVGVKTSFFDDKAHLNVALFNTKRENFFIRLPGSTEATQDGVDENNGIELEAELFPIAGWSITGNAVVMDAESKSNVLASNAAFGVVNQSIKGYRPTAVSEKIFSIFSNYKIQSGFAEGVSFGIGAVHKGDAYADSLNLYKVPSYTVYNAVVAYKQPKWEATIVLDNLTNKTYYTSPTFAGALPGSPRSLFASLKFDFN
jgi:iron complex outermembrane recepter protein